MVTNRKIAPLTAPAPARRTSPEPHSFIAVHKRRREEDHEKLRAERLRKWNELGRRLEANGWHHLEAAIERAERVHQRATRPNDWASQRDAGYGPFLLQEAEQLAINFVGECDVLIAHGGPAQLWTILVTDRDECAKAIVDAVTVEKLQEGNVDEMCLLTDAAHCYALAAFANMASGEDRQDARLLFGDRTNALEAAEVTLARFAPFATDNRMDDREDRIRDAVRMFATAQSAIDLVDAADYLTLGLEAKEERVELRPIQRMGLIAWLAQQVETRAKGGAK